MTAVSIVRFIEFMPLDAQEHWSRNQVVSQAEIVERIGAVYPIEPVDRGHQPSERFRYLDGAGEVGSSRASPGRSASRVTGSASPLTAASGTACSRSTTPT